MPNTVTAKAGSETGLLAQTGAPLSLGDATVKASQAAPELNPSTALTVASKGGTVEQNAQVVAHAHKQTARANAAQQATTSSGGGLWGFITHTYDTDIKKPVTDAVSDVGKALNAPLQEVQHEYRYLRDVQARHGSSAAIMEGLGMAGGAVAGTLIAGPGEGTILGAEAVGGIEGQISYKTSWNRTTTGAKYKTPTTGDVISIGRTVAHLLGMNPTTRNYSTLSGVVDGISDLVLTPLGLAGKVAGAAKSAEGAKGLVGKLWGGIGLQSPDDVERAYSQYKSVRNSFTWIAQHNAGDIVARYGQKLGPIAGDLGDASTAEEVKTVFKDVVAANELRTTDQLPTSTTASAAAFGIRTALGNTDQLPSALEMLMRPVAATARSLNKVPGGFIDDSGTIQTKLDPLSGQGARTIYDMAKYSQSENTARWLAESYIYAEPADRIKIFRNAVMSTIEARAFKGTELLDDPTADLDYEQIATPATRQKFKEYMDHLTGGENPATGGEYGKNADGKEMGTLYTPKTDRTFNTALLPSQTGSFTIPDFKAIKRMGTELRGGKGYVGKADTWLYDHVTQPIFKRWVLLTPAYALHMSAAEQVLNTLRDGVRPMLSGALHAAYGRLGYKIEQDDLAGFALWRHRLYGTVLHTQDRLEADAQLYANLEGHPTPDAISAGHGTSAMQTTDENASKVLKDLSRQGVGMRKGKEFASYVATDPDYLDAWQQAAREMGRNEVGQRAAGAYIDATEAGAEHAEALRKSGEAATDWLRHTMSEEERNLFPAARMFSAGDHPAGWDELDTWGNRIAQSMHGLMSTDNDLGIARSMADGEAPTMQDLEAVDPSLRPSVVKGRKNELVEESTPSKIASWGFRKILNPTINKLSREPMFATEYWNQYKQLLPQIEDGQLAADEATQIAVTRAANKSIKFVHNIHTRTQWTETVRNWLPFAFAQEQAYKRAGRLLVATPGAFRRYQLAIQGVGHYVNAKTGPTGTKYFEMPGSGILGKGVPGLLAHLGMPMTNATASIAGNFTAANVIFPLSTGFRPDLSPVAVLAAKALTAIFPEMTPFATKVIGSETLSQPAWTQIIPNSAAQRIIETVVATKYQPFANSMVDIMQQLDYEQNEAMQKWIAGGRQGAKPDFVPPSTAPPREMQQFVNKVRNQTRVLYGVKTLLGLTSPVSPEIEIQTWGLVKELTADIKKEGSASKGLTVFLKKNPNATPYSISKSYATTAGTPTGVHLTESVQAQKWYDQNKTTLAEHPYGAAWLMPQPSTAKFNYQVYNEQLADHMRAKYAPATFLDQLYIAAGNSAYYANNDKFQSALTAATGTKTQTTALYQQWTSYKHSLQAASPIWATYFNSDQRKTTATKAINTLRTMQAKGLFPDNPQANAVKQLLAAYTTAEQQYVAANSGYDYAKQQSAVKQAWFTYLTGIKKQFPRLEPIVQSVFEDALGTTNPAGG